MFSILSLNKGTTKKLFQFQKNCGECDFSTVHNSSLKRHMQLVHKFQPLVKQEDEEKKYSCFTCEFKTNHQFSLTRHIETIHEKNTTNNFSNVRLELLTQSQEF